MLLDGGPRAALSDSVSDSSVRLAGDSSVRLAPIWNVPTETVDVLKFYNKTTPPNEAKTDTLGHTKNKNDPGARWWWFENDLGEVIKDKKRIKEITNAARDYFNQMAAEGGPMPASWEFHASARHKEAFNAMMEEKFPELRLCAGHWKAIQCAIICYSGWKHHRKNLWSATKTEDADVKMEAPVVVAPAVVPEEEAPSASSKSKGKRRADLEDLNEEGRAAKKTDSRIPMAIPNPL